jgi:hypothetical protein
MQFKPLEPGIEISGETVGSTIDAFRNFPSLAKKYLEKFGLIKPGQSVLDRRAWYPQEAWLSVHAALLAEVGGNVMFEVGKAIPGGSVPMPPMAKDIHTAMVALDIGYHLNHRKNGQVMFDPATGQMLEGIGHYTHKPVPGENRIIVTATNPYDCDFDRGLLVGLVTKFEPLAKVLHDNRKPCRKKGSNSCTYIVSW